MKVDKYKCDQCGKETEDVYEKDWIVLEGSFSLSLGRDPKSKFAKVVCLPLGACKGRFDFCSLACFAAYLEKEKEKQAKSEITFSAGTTIHLGNYPEREKYKKVGEND